MATKEMTPLKFVSATNEQHTAVVVVNEQTGISIDYALVHCSDCFDESLRSSEHVNLALRTMRHSNVC